MTANIDIPPESGNTVTEFAQIDQETIESAKLISQLRKSKKLHDQFASQFREQYKVSGKLMSEWKTYFRVKIPPDINPQTCNSLNSKMSELHQEASFFKAEAEARLSAYKSTSDEKYRSRFTELVTEYKSKGQKLPAKETLAALAEYAIDDIKNAQVHAEIELSFWKEILADLANSRKLIENGSLNLSVEAKAVQSERYLDALNRKAGY